ncbi:S8/S53 family peptidase [Spirosoma oryzicola]|uniref:S8/S53 family peptidase n=1 Tax=Spirosoma oryzicola TaxID=2898794 RepID=UPI001E4C9DAD|nr:S8/S53 family peptidase [Spirosoma oryzicola]UHG91045.1 S8 family peptidase [Spirosoma oryzicola]
MCLSVNTLCLAQRSLNSSSSWQTELNQRYSTLRQQTRRLARKYNWPIYSDYSRNRRLILQEIDPAGEPIYYTLHNAEAASGTRTQSLYKGGSLQLNLSGSSSTLIGKVGLWDGGQALASHQEFPSTDVPSTVILQQMDKATELNDHTTHLAGTLVARGINPQAKGMAYGARLSIWDYNDDLIEIAAAASGLLVSNHAYGPVAGWVYNPSRPGSDPTLKWEWWGNTSISTTEDYLFGFYTAKARDFDRIAYNNPFYLMVRSADNKRAETGPPTGTPYFLKNTTDKSTLVRSRNNAYDVIPAEATAKNVLTVGAADVTRTDQNQPASISTTSFSGWGPTDDGRIKPDLLGMGSDIFSTLSTNSSAYGNYTGTSMASANVTGSLALLQELYAQQKAAINSQFASQFMRSATLRGLVLHTADRDNPAAGPDYRQGWGLLNTEVAARVILNTSQTHLILEKTLEAGGTFTQRLTAQGTDPLIITLCWTDPEGAATPVVPASLNSQTPKLVNDLDIRLSDGRITTLPFVLDPNKPANSATPGDNMRDNVEQIYLSNPVPGQVYTLTVSHKSTMTYAGQPFSVIVSGLRGTQCPFTATVSPKDATLCTGDSVLLHSENKTGFSYQWLFNNSAIKSAISASYAATQVGSYTLRITDASGCSIMSAPVSVQTKAPRALISPATTQLLCPNGPPLQLTATNAVDGQIEWLRNGTVLPDAQSTTLTVVEPGRYQVRLTQQDCQSLSDSVSVRQSTVGTVSLKPAETELVLLRGATVTLYAPTGTDYRYQWYRDNNILANAADYRLSVSEQGVYKVRVTQQNCVGWSTERTVHLPVLTAVSLPTDSLFTVYPNPAEQTLTIQYAYPNTSAVTISVLDINGQSHLSPALSKASNGQIETTLTVSDLPAGVYYLRVIDRDRARIARFIKK